MGCCAESQLSGDVALDIPLGGWWALFMKRQEIKLNCPILLTPALFLRDPNVGEASGSQQGRALEQELLQDSRLTGTKVSLDSTIH